MIDRQVYNHSLYQNYIQFAIFHASCCSIYLASSRNTIYKIFYKTPELLSFQQEFFNFYQIIV